MHPPHALDQIRRAAGFRTVDEVAALAPSVLVLDPASTLVGVGVTIGTGAVLYPDTVLETRNGGTIDVVAEARLGPGPVTVLADGARVRIDRAELGPGGVTLTATATATATTAGGALIGAPEIVIGDGARLAGGCTVEAPAQVGAGAQILGTVALRDVVLGGGADHRNPDPDRRGAVVKGAGRVHGIRIDAGEVVVARTDVSDPERQRAHHPGAPRT